MAGNSKAYDLVVYGATGFTVSWSPKYREQAAGTHVMDLRRR